MAKGQRKHYTKELKLSAVYMMLSKVYKTSEIVEMLKVDRQTLYRWVKEFKENGEKAFILAASLRFFILFRMTLRGFVGGEHCPSEEGMVRTSIPNVNLIDY